MTTPETIDEAALMQVADANVENATSLLTQLNSAIASSGITSEALAERMGVTVETVESVGRYDYDPRFSELRRLANALGFVVEYQIGTA